MMLLEEVPVVQKTEDIKFCHTYCGECGPPLTFCGAYKPKPCGGRALDLIDGQACQTCGRALCMDCMQTAIHESCRRCNSV